MNKVHFPPRYNPNRRGKSFFTNDIALARLSQSVKFRYTLNTEGSILPICWSDELSMDEMEGEEQSVYVAGWGHTGDMECNTGKYGPSPYSKCMMPFMYRGIEHYGCASLSPPSKLDRRCRELQKIMDKRGEGKYENVLTKYDSIHIKGHRGLRTLTECYSMKHSAVGWCATCNPEATKPEDPGYCRAHQYGR